MKIEHYVNEEGVDVFLDWFNRLRDKQAKINIERRIYRLGLGQFGQVKPAREGVWELKIDIGAGYRVYYAQVENTLVLLLCGGNKKSQDTDIDRAISYWKNYQQRQKERG